ncbi:MAG: ribonuclease E/G [Hyphomonas sp.]
MPVRRILREDCVGETRAVAFDGAGLPVALWLDRWSDRLTGRLRVGDVRDARIRSLDPALRGGFADLGPGRGTAFIRLPNGHGLTEGQTVRFRVEAEANRTKLPRGVLAQNAILHRVGFDDWCAFLPGGKAAAVDAVSPGAEDVRHAFEDVLAREVPIPNGGIMTIERTTALTAADVDSSGRTGRGSAASRALQINSDAARELARQVSLRGLGGLVVLDCVAPINPDSGRRVRDAFLAAWQDISLRNARAEPPSAFGLLETSIAWGQTPVEDLLAEADGTPLPEAACLDGLRSLETALSRNRMDTATLRLPAHAHDAYQWMTAAGLDLPGALAEKYGPRFQILAADIPQPEVA